MGRGELNGTAQFVSWDRPIAWASILFDANIGPSSRNGTVICQGNRVDSNAMLKIAGKTIAASHSIVFHFRKVLLSEGFIGTSRSLGNEALATAKRLTCH